MPISDNEKHAPILNIIFGRNKLLLLNCLTKNLRVFSCKYAFIFYYEEN